MDDAPVAVVADQLRRRPTSGIATYTRGLLGGLRRLGDEAPPLVLVASRGPDRDPLETWGWPVWSSRLPGRLLTRVWDRGGGGGLVAGAGVVHATSLAAPVGAAAPLAVAVHDLAWRQFPETFPRRGRRWHEAALARALRRATVLVTPAEATAERLREAGAGPDQVVVIPEGCDHLPVADAEGAAATLGALGVSGPYLLSVATLEPRKNLSRLVAAYTQARDRLPEPWPLVVVGPRGWGAAMAPAAGVKLAGVVSDPVLAGLYAGARCLAYVPLGEGWGLPPVEAMSACVPVVASPVPSTGGAALEVDPTDVDAIADALVVATGDDRRRSELVTAGLLRAGELTWAATAAAHARLWRSMAGTTRRPSGRP
jgi:glycosyltransferase involved in cell wall biosynthesis